MTGSGFGGFNRGVGCLKRKGSNRGPVLGARRWSGVGAHHLRAVGGSTLDACSAQRGGFVLIAFRSLHLHARCANGARGPVLPHPLPPCGDNQVTHVESVLSRKEAARAKGGLEAMEHSRSGGQLHYPMGWAGAGKDIGYCQHAVMQTLGTSDRAGRRLGLPAAVRLSPTAGGCGRVGVSCQNPPPARPIHPPPYIPSENCLMRTVLSECVETIHCPSGEKATLS